jgi:hypothetical protein
MRVCEPRDILEGAIIGRVTPSETSSIISGRQRPYHFASQMFCKTEDAVLTKWLYHHEGFRAAFKALGLWV